MIEFQQGGFAALLMQVLEAIKAVVAKLLEHSTGSTVGSGSGTCFSFFGFYVFALSSGSPAVKPL